MSGIKVVAGVNIKEIGGIPHVLLGLKPNGNWEFPGGKVEEGENDEQALVREWKEEVNVDIKINHRLTTLGSSIYSVSFYSIDIEDKIDKIYNLKHVEHIEIIYHPIDKDMKELNMNEANRTVLEELWDGYGRE